MNYFRCGGGRSTHTATKIDVAKTPLATFQSNVSGLYLPEILAYIQATQSGSGDPSPSNPRAITGRSAVNVTRTGANLWDEEWQSGAYSIETGAYFIANNRIASANFIPIKANSTYSIVAPYTGTFDVLYYDANKSYIGYKTNRSGRVFTTPTNCYYINISVWSNYGTTYNNDISINYPSTDTAYHAYTGQTATTALGGTCYGGYLNVPTGLLTVNKGIVDMSTLNYNTASWGAYRASLSDSLDYITSKLADAIAEKYAVTTYTNLNQNKPNNYFALYNKLVYVVADDLPTGQLVYPLATPQTVQLTPAQIEQLLGQNNVFCSSGDVAVKFWKVD